MKKLLFLGMISIMGISVAFANNANTHQCLTCSITPQLLNDYIQFSYDILGAIETTNPNVKEYGNPKGLFSEGDLTSIINSPDKVKQGLFKSSFQGLKNNIKKKVQGFQTTAKLLTRLTVSLDSARALWIVLTKSSAIVRDYKKLIELDDVIGDKMQAMGMAGVFDKTITVEHANNIHRIALQYNGSGKLFSSGTTFTFDRNATYGQLLGLMWKVNSKYKNFVAFGTTDQFEKYDDVKQVSKGKVTLTFGQNYAKNLATAYQCGRYVRNCSKGIKKFPDDIKNMRALSQSGVIDSVHQMSHAMVRLQKSLQGFVRKRDKIKSRICTIKNCSKKFANAGLCTRGDNLRYTKIDNTNTYFNFIKTDTWEKISHIVNTDESTATKTSIPEAKVRKICQFTTREMGKDPKNKKDIDDFLTREKELLNTQFNKHIGEANINTSLWGKVGKFFKRKTLYESDQQTNTQTVKQKISNAIKKPINAVDQMIQNIKNRKEKRDIIKELFEQEDFSFDQNKYNRLKTFHTNLAGVVHQVITNHTETLLQATSADTRDITTAIWAMVQKVRYATHMIKNKDNPRSLVNNLGEACEGQCSNLGGKCRNK